MYICILVIAIALLEPVSSSMCIHDTEKDILYRLFSLYAKSFEE